MHAPAASFTPLVLPAFFGRDTAAARACAAFDWSTTPLGPLDRWQPELRTAVSLCFSSDFAAAIYWGEDWTLIPNDELLTLFASRGAAPGQTGAQLWGAWWQAIAADFATVAATRIGITEVEKPFEVRDDGPARLEFWNYSYTPVMDGDGRVVGMFVGLRQATAQVHQRHTDALLVALDDELIGGTSVDAMIEATLRVLGSRLSAQRTGFGEIDLAAKQLEIRPCWTDGTMPDLAGRYPLGTFGRISDELAAGRTVVIEDNQSDPRTNDAQTRAQYEIAGLRAGLVIPIIDEGRYAGGLFVQSSQPKRWLPHEIALAEAGTRRMWHAIMRKRTDIARRESEQRYRLVFEQAEDIIFTADIEQRITDCNAAAARAIGLSRDAIIGRSIGAFVSADGFVQTTAMLQHKLDHGGNTRHEVVVTAPDGRIMRWDNNSTLVRDLEEKPVGLLSISRDVTERRAFDARRELLIHELNHRVKNTLSLVQGLAHQSFRAGQDVDTAAADFLSRLTALATAHDLLTREHWEGVSIGDVVGGATAHAGERVAASGPHLLISPKSAVALVMALHELTTNAVKYGALSVSDGQIAVEWAPRDDARFMMTWREHGGPAVVAPERLGFGVRMIERALASDLGGVVNVNFAATGVVCTIDGPVLA